MSLCSTPDQPYGFKLELTFKSSDKVIRRTAGAVQSTCSLNLRFIRRKWIIVVHDLIVSFIANRFTQHEDFVRRPIRLVPDDSATHATL